MTASHWFTLSLFPCHSFKRIKFSLSAADERLKNSGNQRVRRRGPLQRVSSGLNYMFSDLPWSIKPVSPAGARPNQTAASRRTGADWHAVEGTCHLFAQVPPPPTITYNKLLPLTLSLSLSPLCFDPQQLIEALFGHKGCVLFEGVVRRGVGQALSIKQLAGLAYNSVLNYGGGEWA